MLCYVNHVSCITQPLNTTWVVSQVKVSSSGALSRKKIKSEPLKNKWMYGTK